MLVTQLNHEDRLIDIGDDFVVHSLEVSCQGYWLVIPDELVGHWCDLEVDVVHSVGTLVTPVCDDGLTAELETNGLLPLMLTVIVTTHFHDALKASLRSHELKDVVHSQSDSKFRLEGRGLET